MRLNSHIAAVVLLVLIVGTAEALPVRSITTLDVDSYSYGDTGIRMKEVGILRLKNGWSTVLKAEWEKVPAATKIKGTAGLVFGLFPGSYMELSYGLALADQSEVSHILNTDLYYEQPNLLIMLTNKLEVGSETTNTLPGLGVKWSPVVPLSLWGKYTASFDKNTGFDNSFWGETEYRLGTAWSVKAGGTVGSYHADQEASRDLEYSFLTGLGFSPYEGIRFSYQFEYLIREEYRVLTNLLVGDISF